MPNWSITLRDGLILSAFAVVMLTVVVLINPRIMMQDYPADVKAKAPPKTAHEQRLTRIFGIPFMLLLLGLPLVSTLLVKSQAAQPVPFFQLYLHAFGVMFLFNLVDWLILDWLLFCTITPRFMVIPGTEGMAGYKDYFFHFRGFLIGTVFSAVGGLIVAAVAWLV